MDDKTMEKLLVNISKDLSALSVKIENIEKRLESKDSEIESFRQEFKNELEKLSKRFLALLGGLVVLAFVVFSSQPVKFINFLKLIFG